MSIIVRKVLHFLGYTLYAAAYIGFLILLIWMAERFDLAEDPYDGNDNPNSNIYQEYGGR